MPIIKEVSGSLLTQTECLYIVNLVSLEVSDKNFSLEKDNEVFQKYPDVYEKYKAFTEKYQDSPQLLGTCFTSIATMENGKPSVIVFNLYVKVKHSDVVNLGALARAFCSMNNLLLDVFQMDVEMAKRANEEPPSEPPLVGMTRVEYKENDEPLVQTIIKEIIQGCTPNIKLVVFS